MNMSKFKFAGIEIDNLSFAEALNRIEELIKKKEKGYIVTPNASHIVLLQKDEEFKKAYKNAKLVLADGVPIIFASKLLGRALKERCAGADLFIEMCKIAGLLNKNIFLLGGMNGSEKKAEKKLKQMFPNINIISYSPPFGFEDDGKTNAQIINLINNSNVHVLFLFIGTPKGEKWIYKWIDKLKIVFAGELGATLEFFVGTKKRAPKWMQKIGLEWLFRLIQEPRRLWKRYLIGNTIFLWLVLKEFIKQRL